MKHAYLIIAHHEFDVLTRLVAALDDVRNDIYIHIDKNAAAVPSITADCAAVHLLEDRIDVRWGDVSQVQTELLLFEEAANHGPYQYYHMLSGVDMPIKSQDYIHHFFDLHQGREFIGFDAGDRGVEVERKIQRYHLFPRSFREGHGIAGLLRKVLRSLFLRMQEVVGFRRYPRTVFRKGTNWVSVTQAFVSLVLERKNELLKRYKHTYCADEVFLQTLCWNSDFRHRLFDVDSEANGSMRMIGWVNNRLVDWEDKDFGILTASSALFARKFNSRHLEVVERILHKIKGHD